MGGGGKVRVSSWHGQRARNLESLWFNICCLANRDHNRVQEKTASKRQCNGKPMAYQLITVKGAVSGARHDSRCVLQLGSVNVVSGFLGEAGETRRGAN